MTELVTWDGSSFVASNDYRSNIDLVVDSTTHTVTQLTGVFDGSQKMTATVTADNNRVIFNYPSLSFCG